MARRFFNPLKDNTYRVIDGDTVEVVLDRGWGETKTTSLRFVGLNAPETHTKNLQEKEAGKLVQQIVERWMKVRAAANLQLYASSEEKPKYEGRTIGRIWAEEESDCLNDFLLSMGVVKPYTGSGKRGFSKNELQAIIEIAGEHLAEE